MCSDLLRNNEVDGADEYMEGSNNKLMIQKDALHTASLHGLDFDH